MTDLVQPSWHQLALPGITFSAWRWSPGDALAHGRRVVILHGVTANALTFAGVARELVADGWTVDALDLPGHGGTRWTDQAGRPLADQESVDRSAYDLANVGQLVAAAMRALPDMEPRAATRSATPGKGSSPMRSPGAPALLGHSWGAGVAAIAIDAGAEACQLVLEDPPFLSAQQGAEMAADFHADLTPELEGARAVVRSWNPESSADEVEVRAHELADPSPLAADAVVRGAPWDAIGLMAGWRRRHPELRVDVIAGDAMAGGLIPSPVLGVLRSALGAEHVHELGGLGHSPHRDDPERFLAVLRGILG
jgi:pimeloyl-ACP methyl ester carboxylesterase